MQKQCLKIRWYIAIVDWCLACCFGNP